MQQLFETDVSFRIISGEEKRKEINKDLLLLLYIVINEINSFSEFMKIPLT